MFLPKKIVDVYLVNDYFVLSRWRSSIGRAADL